MKFGHLVEGKLVEAKFPIKYNNADYFTSDPKVLLTLGEKEVIATPAPEVSFKGKYAETWNETDTKIIREWTFIPYTETELHVKYEERTRAYIARKYSSADENKVLREYLAYGDSYKTAFDEYNTYVEECKARAKAEVYGE